MASRVLHIPISGRDRRHYANELRKAEREYERLTREVAAAHAIADRALAEAYRLDSELWSTRLFLGGPDEPSPTIANALHGGHELLLVKCRHCNHEQTVDLALVIWPRERPVRTIRRALYCAPNARRDTVRSVGRTLSACGPAKSRTRRPQPPRCGEPFRDFNLSTPYNADHPSGPPLEHVV